jgi:glycosyltransferase involved in cell wall biosynthesis
VQILFLTQVLPYPLDAGPKVRAYHMLCCLAERHAVTLVSFVRPDDRPEAVAHLREFCRGVHTVPMRRSLARNLQAAAKGLLTGLPMVVARDEVAEMAARLDVLTRETAFDVVHADQLSMAGYGRQAARAAAATRRGVPPRTLLDEHNAIYRLTERMAATERRPLRRLLMAREARAFQRYEAAMLRSYDAVLTVSEEDRAQLAALCGLPAAVCERKFSAIPICVDPQQTAVVPRRPDGVPTILHLGTMFWPPNVTAMRWFVNEVLPLVWERVPGARFVIAGKNPPPEVAALAADPRIQVTGYVADPAPLLAEADAFVVPLLAGGGMRVKILDAWCWGLPVVATPIGAEGIEMHDGVDILLAGEAPAFADATVRLLTDPQCNASLRAAGRAWVEQRYAHQTVYNRVEEIYRRLAGNVVE